MNSANAFGNRFVLTSFGESHGSALGVVLDGIPAGIKWDERLLLLELSRRRPGQSKVVSARDEKDQPEVLSGIYKGRTLGTPIAIIVRNHDQRSDDYKKISNKPRAGHADDMWKLKFGHADPRGGGRSSGRETLSRVIGGAIAQMLIQHMQPTVRTRGFAAAIASYQLTEVDRKALHRFRKNNYIDLFTARFPSKVQEKSVEALLLKAKTDGKSYGGVAEIWIDGLPYGLGQPVFHKLKADFASAMMSVGATAGLEIGGGFSTSREEGSVFHSSELKQDRYGGIRGGISTGERIVIRVAFKPTSSVLEVAKKGRHDPCIVPRAIPVLEAMANLVIADHLLWARTDRV